MTGSLRSGPSLLRQELDRTIETIGPLVEALLQRLSPSEAITSELGDAGLRAEGPLESPHGGGRRASGGVSAARGGRGARRSRGHLPSQPAAPAAVAPDSDRGALRRRQGPERPQGRQRGGRRTPLPPRPPAGAL